MKRTLLFVLTLLITATMFAAKENLTLSDLGAGWDSSYDSATKTITFNSAWTGRGWWLDGKDYSAYNEVVLNFEAVAFTVKLVVEYSNEEVVSSEGYADAGVTSITIPLDPTGKSNVKQIYIQTSDAGTLTLKEAYLTDGEAEVASSVYNFDAESVSTVYKTMHAWGWPDATTVATVESNPLGTGNCLKMHAGNYDAVTYFTVTLPEGSSVADITGIQFDSYFGDKTESAAVEIFMAPADAAVGNGAAFSSYPVYLKSSDGTEGKPASVQVSVNNEWYTVLITRAQILDDAFNFGVKHDFAAIDNLSQFLFGIGISVAGGTEYYLDNITFVLGTSGTKAALVDRPLVYPVTGGIFVSGNNDKVSVFGFDGRLVKQIQAGNQFISLAKGLYIVKIGNAKAEKVLVQ